MAAKPYVLLKGAVAIACMAPFVWLAIRAFELGGSTLGANPVETVLHTSGRTGLNILFVTLAVTPVRIVTGINQLLRMRRMLGLFSFFYVLLHFVTYTALDLRFEWGTLFVDITERPYITVGMLALLGMIPLAITSTNKMQRRLGRRWASLHRTTYVIACLGLVHFFWQVKLDTREPLIYCAILAVLLGYRIARSYRLRRRRLSY